MMNISGFSALRVIAPSTLVVACLLASAPGYALQSGSNKVAPALQSGSNKVAPALQSGSNKVAPALQSGSNKVAASSGFSTKTATQQQECALSLSVSGAAPCSN
jgi:hypothetical protein